MGITSNSCNQKIIQYDVQTGSATHTLNQVSPSTATYVLTSNGVGAQPSFQPVAASGATVSIDVDEHTAPGTDPVVPDGTGKIAITGGQVAAGTTSNVIQTNSLNANSFVIQVQRSDAVGTTDVTQNGVAHFYNNDFSVDGNAFVTLNCRAFTSFNPTFSFSGDSTGIVYTLQIGSYSVIGNVCFFDIVIQTSSKGSGVGEFRIDLPLPCTAQHGMRVHGMFSDGGTLPVGATYTIGNCEVGTSYMTITCFGSAFNSVNATNTNVSNVSAIYAGGSYVTTL